MAKPVRPKVMGKGFVPQTEKGIESCRRPAPPMPILIPTLIHLLPPRQLKDSLDYEMEPDELLDKG